MQKGGIKKWHKRWWGIMLIIIAAFLLSLSLAFVLYIIDLSSSLKNNLQLAEITRSTSLTEEQRSLIEKKNNYWLGTAEPKITIVEFGDFACGYCQNSFPKIREISLKYKNDVKYIFRDFPALGDNSVNLALAGRCAGEQGLFWLMHDKLFQNQGVTELTALIELANQIGADTKKFQQCLQAKKYLKNIQTDFDDGQSLNIAGTPTWFINGQMVEGDIPYNIFIQLIEQLIKQ